MSGFRFARSPIARPVRTQVGGAAPAAAAGSTAARSEAQAGAAAGADALTSDSSQRAMTTLATETTRAFLAGVPEAALFLHGLTRMFPQPANVQPLTDGILAVLTVRDGPWVRVTADAETIRRVLGALGNVGDRSPIRERVQAALGGSWIGEIEAMARTDPHRAADELVALWRRSGRPPEAEHGPRLVTMFQRIMPQLLPAGGTAEVEAILRAWDDRHGVESGRRVNDARTTLARYTQTMEVFRQVDPIEAMVVAGTMERRSEAYRQRERQGRRSM